MRSGRGLVVLSFAAVAAALLLTAVFGWLYGLALYVASVLLFGLRLRQMMRQQRKHSHQPSPPAADNAGGAAPPHGALRPRS